MPRPRPMVACRYPILSRILVDPSITQTTGFRLVIRVTSINRDIATVVMGPREVLGRDTYSLVTSNGDHGCEKIVNLVCGTQAKTKKKCKSKENVLWWRIEGSDG
ncbi:Uncharacterized protein TCM_009937 [Theobroma cacao]|uniref:Uncharacterized protein n=1 Tax=Theobroma cacao TaxID=3641 RepID=A0A061ED71_THECC|nr:Uncharacterized protein TCM_009937 [Theobroma cacao]